VIGDPERQPVSPLPLAVDAPAFVPLVELLLPTPVPVEPVPCVAAPGWVEFGEVAVPVPLAPVPVGFEVPGALVLGLVCAGWLLLGLLVFGEVVLGEEVWGVVAGLLWVCEEPVLEGVLSGAVLCASTQVPDSSTREISVALPFITPPINSSDFATVFRDGGGGNPADPLRGKRALPYSEFSGREEKLREADLVREAGQQLRG
jgi:hypothetical protein